MDSSPRHETSLEQHVIVPTSVGDLTVVDFGGSGLEVLMFHSPGFCAESLSAVAADLEDRCHTWSVELPGHGQCRTDGLDAAGFWTVIPELAAGLGLVRPVLVGFDMSGFLVTAAAATHPQLASAVVSVGGWCLRTRAESAEFLAFLTSDDVMDGLAERMLLGATSRGEAGMRKILTTLAHNAIHDFLIADEESRFSHRIACTVQRTPDGSYVRLPTVATLRRLYDLDPDGDVYPELGLLDRVDAPYLFVLTTDGMDAELVDRATQWTSRRQGTQVDLIEAGNNPQMSHPADVARAIAAFLAQLS